jgi:Tfp pilus assembly protein PilZ
MKEGDTVFLTVGDRPEDQQVEVAARIAWRRPLGGSKSLYGVRLADPK